MPKSTAYILVHGGDSDGAVWDQVAALLRNKNNIVFAPSMTSIKKASLAQNIDEIGEVITSQHLDHVVLVGHSYGAMVITGVADKFAHKISSLVYVDSVVPENEKSLYQLFSQYGVDYKSYGLTPDTPCMEHLYFNEDLIKQKLKVYIHCLKSEFINLGTPVYQTVTKKALQDNWVYFCLDTLHKCMSTQPRELASILFGIKVLLEESDDTLVI